MEIESTLEELLGNLIKTRLNRIIGDLDYLKSVLLQPGVKDGIMRQFRKEIDTLHYLGLEL